LFTSWVDTTAKKPAVRWIIWVRISPRLSVSSAAKRFIPSAGFARRIVKIVGEDGDEENPRSFSSKPVVAFDSRGWSGHEYGARGCVAQHCVYAWCAHGDFQTMTPSAR
jgi:hypothetical protein